MIERKASPLLPPDALRLPVGEAVTRLRSRFGPAIDLALSSEATDMATPASALPEALQARVHGDASGLWMKQATMVGVNVRTVGSFWRVIHYALTLSPLVDTIHLLPIWEPGVVGSLYGMASWQLNAEFLDPELAGRYPHLSTLEAQLRATINVLHATGRAVGMDVIPHTDRFSEIVLAQPAHFEWLRRTEKRIVDHRAHLHEEVEAEVLGYLEQAGPAVSGLSLAGPAHFFGPETSEATRSMALFGAPEDANGRNRRRAELIARLHAKGYEPVPATMAPPFRGLEIDPATRTVDSTGAVWVDYRITRPEGMSRVFGPLARYKLYERIDDNRQWEIDFNRPRREVWTYVCDHYTEIQGRFGFDFMRGDMSHVQMRPEGVPAVIPEHYDLLGSVKRAVGRQVSSFGYFAETFVAPPGVMLYGNEMDHLEASDADVTLGDLQSVAVATDEFQQRLRQYLDIAATRRVTPCFTLMTGDKDDPRFDEFYLAGNELRLFCGLFLPLPCYVALGFELRDPHPEPAPNEYYTKLYVFQERKGPKATHGPYHFGSNTRLFSNLQRIWLVAERLAGETADPTAKKAVVCSGDGSVAWLLPPDATAGRKAIAWTVSHNDSRLLFVANCDTVAGVTNLKIPLRDEVPVSVNNLFTTLREPDDRSTMEADLARDGMHLCRLGPGECRIYGLTVQSAEVAS